MNATQYFKRMTLDELVGWFNVNVAANAFGPFCEIMTYDEANLMRVVEYCGIEQYTEKMIADAANHIGNNRSPRYLFYDIDTATITTYSTEKDFMADFLDAMLEEYENQVPNIDAEE